MNKRVTHHEVLSLPKSLSPRRMQEFTQKALILHTLRRRKLTQDQAREMFGVQSLSSQVRKLRDDGYPILSQPYTRTLDTGRRVTAVRYTLAQ